MAWARLDDGFHSHPDTLEAGLAANGLFARALSYAAHYQTDGFIPDVFIQAHVPSTRRNWDPEGVVQACLDHGFFNRVAGGFQIVNYLDFNPSRAELESKRKKDRTRKRLQPDSARNPNRIAAESA